MNQTKSIQIEPPEILSALKAAFTSTIGAEEPKIASYSKAANRIYSSNINAFEQIPV